MAGGSPGWPLPLLLRLLLTLVCCGGGVLGAIADPQPLPDPPCNKRSFNVPMSDGQVLVVNAYTLQTVEFGTRLPVNYQAFPYDAYTEKAIVLQWAAAQLLNMQPPHVFLIQRMRGNGEGAGEFRGLDVGGDVADTVAWLRGQPWFNGVLFGTGTSAMGVMSYLSAMVGVSFRAQAVSLAGADGHRMAYQNGAYRAALVRGMLRFLNQTQYEKTYMAHEEPDAWWNSTTLAGHYDSITWPALHVAGWYDVFQQDTIDVFHAYRRLAHPAVRDLQFLVVEPKGHCFSGGAVRWPDLQLTQLGLLVSTLSGMLFGVLREAASGSSFQAGLSLLRILAKGIPRVFWYVMGSGLKGTKGNWIAAAAEFPTPSPTPYYVARNGRLALEAPAEAAQLRYVYDPRNPMSTYGGNNMGVLPFMGALQNLQCGPWDQLPGNANRTDVLTFNSTPLTADLAITGPVRVVLFVSSNATDTDFTAKLVDVFPNGTRLLIADGVQRMRWRRPERGPLPMRCNVTYRIEIDLWSTSYIFSRRHSVGLDVSSSNAPRFDVNPNTGLPLRVSSAVADFNVAENAIHFGGSEASYLQLPVVPLSAV
eukprot:EG_transcript_7574